MFDPLDFMEPTAGQIGDRYEEQTIEEYGYQLKASSPEENEFDYLDHDSANHDNNDNTGVITVLDLPAVAYASPKVILCVLRLLRPDMQVNFQAQQHTDVAELFQTREISDDLQQSILHYYNSVFPNDRLNTIEKIATKIPSLIHTSNGGELGGLLDYYTSILKKYENFKESDSNCFGTNDSHLYDLLVREVSLRISEQCGRSAQPSMYRNFKFQGLSKTIQLYEPTLTADNLGWKTWGSALVLSQILISEFLTGLPKARRDTVSNVMTTDGNSRPLKVLELGAGTGLVGISWAYKYKELYGKDLSSKQIEMYVTDLPDIVENLRVNININGLNDFVVADVLDWTDPEPFTAKHGVEDNDFDIILIADPIYSPNHPQWIVNMISKFLAKDGVCFLEIPIRPKYAKERDLLSQLLRSNNFEVIREKYDESRDDWGMVKYLYREIKHQR